MCTVLWPIWVHWWLKFQLNINTEYLKLLQYQYQLCFLALPSVWQQVDTHRCSAHIFPPPLTLWAVVRSKYLKCCCSQHTVHKSCYNRFIPKIKNCMPSISCQSSLLYRTYYQRSNFFKKRYCVLKLEIPVSWYYANTNNTKKQGSVTNCYMSIHNSWREERKVKWFHRILQSVTHQFVRFASFG